MVPMTMPDKDVFDPGRIEPELAESRDEDGFHSFRVSGIDQHDPVGGRDRIDRRFRIAYGIDVIEELYWLQLGGVRIVRSCIGRNTKEVERLAQEGIVTRDF